MRTIILLALALAACTPDHPFDKPGTWNPDNHPSANDLNLKAMVANPQDLVAGRGNPNSLGAEAAPAAQRLLTGHRAKLPNSDIIQIQVTGSDQSQPANNSGQ